MEATNAIRKQNLRSLRVDASQLSELDQSSGSRDESRNVDDLSLPEIVVHVPTLPNDELTSRETATNPVPRRTQGVPRASQEQLRSPLPEVGPVDPVQIQAVHPESLFENTIATSLDQEELVRQLLSQITPLDDSPPQHSESRSTQPSVNATRSDSGDALVVEERQEREEAAAIVPKRAVIAQTEKTDQSRAHIDADVINRPEKSQGSVKLANQDHEDVKPAPSEATKYIVESSSERDSIHPTSTLSPQIVDAFPQVEAKSVVEETRPTDRNDVPRKHRIDAAHQQPVLQDEQYLELIDNLVAQAVNPESSLLMFTTAGPLSSSSDHLEQIANHYLTRVTHSNVLLVDGRMTERHLSRRHSAIDSTGLAEAIHGSMDWRELVRDTRRANLSFLPAGNGYLSFRKATRNRLSELCSQWKQSFDCIIIDGGERDGMVPRLLCPFCDATYLMVTLGKTGKVEARAAVTELRAYGARLLGCITSD